MRSFKSERQKSCRWESDDKKFQKYLVENVKECSYDID